MDRRSGYLRVALDHFLRDGYNGVSVDSIVAAAGGSKATFYRYFDSKEQLFGSIIDDLAKSMLATSRMEDLDALPLEDGLRSLGLSTADAALSEAAVSLLRLSMGEFSRFPELSRMLWEGGPSVSYRRFRAFVETRLDRDDLFVPDLQIAAEQFFGGIIGHQQLRVALGQDPPTSSEIERRVTAAVEAFLKMYRR